MSTIEQQAYPLYQELIAKFVREIRRDESQSRQNSPMKLTRAHMGDIEALWQSFTVDRSQLQRYLMDPAKSRSAYLLGFHLPNLIRQIKVLERTLQRQPPLAACLEQGRGDIHIIDIGCGAGAMTQGWLMYLKKMAIASDRLHIYGFDRHKKLLEAFDHGCHFVLNQGTPTKQPNPNIKTFRIDLNKFDPRRLSFGPEDLVIVNLGYVWNELSSYAARASNPLHQLIEATLTRSKGIVQVLEPANQYPAREWMALRDRCAAVGTIAYPCGHSRPCPMLERKTDWCFSEFAWSPPQEIQWLDKRLGINRQRLATSALCAVSKGIALEGSDQPVVVGRPVVKMTTTKQFRQPFEYLLCQSTGLTKQAPLRAPTLTNPAVVSRGMIYSAKPVVANIERCSRAQSAAVKPKKSRLGRSKVKRKRSARP